MSITEEKLYEAFGLEPPAAEPAPDGANEQEPAAPVTEPAVEGANGQEPAEPAEGTPEPEGADAEGAEDHHAQEPEEPGKQPMSTEERRANAARRREEERRAMTEKAVNDALNAERQKHAEDMKAFFTQMGIRNSETGEPITSMEEFWNWKRGFDSQQLDKDLKSGKASAEQISQLIASHPMVQQAQQIVQQNQAQQQETQRQQREQQEAAERERIDSDMAEIGKLNPGIKSAADLLAMPKYETFKGYVGKGMGLLDAYKLTHMEELTEAKASAAAQQVRNNQRGKEHLTPTAAARGSGAQAVPANVMAMYRAFNPKASEAEIQAHYNKQLRKT